MQTVLEEVYDLKLQVKDMKITLEETLAKLNDVLDEIHERERSHKREVSEMRRMHDRWMDDVVEEFDDFKHNFSSRMEYVEEKKRDLKDWTRSKLDEISSLSRSKTEVAKSPSPERILTPTPIIRPRNDPSKLRCYQCHDMGHIAKNCTNKKILCYKCKRFEGHVAENCPYGDERRERGSSEDSSSFRNDEGSNNYNKFDRSASRRGKAKQLLKRYSPYSSSTYQTKKSKLDDF